MLNLVHYMLNTNNDTKLPFEAWPDCKFWGGIVDAAMARYRSVGSRVAGAVVQDIVGYWSISATDLRCVKCTVFPAATVNPLPWPLDLGAYKFSEPYSWDCTVTFISSGATFKLTGQLSSDVVILDTAAPWPALTSPPLPGGVAGGRCRWRWRECDVTSEASRCAQRRRLRFVGRRPRMRRGTLDTDEKLCCRFLDERGPPPGRAVGAQPRPRSLDIADQRGRHG